MKPLTHHADSTDADHTDADPTDAWQQTRASDPHGRARSSLRGTDYGWWFGADTCGQLSASISSFALPLIALAVTHSAAQAALLESIMSCMQAVFVIPGGLVQDRFDRRMLLLIWSAAGVLVFATAGILQHDGGLTWVALAILAVILGIRSGLLGNTSSAMLRGVVPDEELPEAMALNHGRDAVINIAGSPISGMLMGLGYATPLFVSSLFSLVGGGLALRIRRYWRHDQPGDMAATQSGTVGVGLVTAVKEALEGLRWLCHGSFQRRLALSAALCNGGINGLLLITQMHVQTVTKSSLSAATVLAIASVGMLIGAMASQKLVASVPGGVLCIVFFVLFPLGSLGLALSPNMVWLQGLFLFISMLLLPAGNAVTGGFLSMLVNKGKQGRFTAAMTLCSLVSYAILTWLSGLVMERFGYMTSALMLAGVLVLGSAVILSSRVVRRIPLTNQWEPYIEHSGLERF